MLIIMVYAIFSLSPSTDMMLTGIKQNKILKIKAGRTEEDPWSPEPAKTPSHHHAVKVEGQSGTN